MRRRDIEGGTHPTQGMVQSRLHRSNGPTQAVCDALERQPAPVVQDDDDPLVCVEVAHRSHDLVPVEHRLKLVTSGAGRTICGTLPRTPTARQVDVLAAFVAAGGSVAEAAARVGVRPSTAKRHLADLRARSGLTTEQLIYRGRAAGLARGAEPRAQLNSHRPSAGLPQR